MRWLTHIITTFLLLISYELSKKLCSGDPQDYPIIHGKVQKKVQIGHCEKSTSMNHECRQRKICADGIEKINQLGNWRVDKSV